MGQGAEGMTTRRAGFKRAQHGSRGCAGAGPGRAAGRQQVAGAHLDRVDIVRDDNERRLLGFDERRDVVQAVLDGDRLGAAVVGGAGSLRVFEDRQGERVRGSDTRQPYI